MRVHFEEFAAQLRLRRHHEHRKRILSSRKRHLQNAVALSARLHRVGSWVHVGLVQISTQGDAAGFSRVHQHMQDLIDLCLSQWSHEIQALDVQPSSKSADNESFLNQLQPAIRADCLDLIHTLRAKPSFLVEKFKAMSAAQISALSTFPRFSKLSDSVLSSLSQNRGRNSQRKRIKAYSKELEEYASSFERSNPLSFLLHNVYGTSDDLRSHESRLRISTWSSICASLMMESEPAYDEIIGHVLFAFASLYQWQIKDRLELFLMKILQEGAFLLDRPETSASASQFEFVGNFDAFGTPQAQEFFNEAVKDLLQLLACDDGIPPGALHLSRAIMAKLPSVEDQLKFRGDFIFKWFMRDFLRIALEFPEDEGMLLQFHISDKKRGLLLHHLYDRTSSRAGDVYSSVRSQPVDPAVHCYVDLLIDQVQPYGQYFDPYDASSPSQPRGTLYSPSYVSICAADITHILDSLSPQFIHTSSTWDSFMSSSHSAFSMQYPISRTSGRFDKLRQAVLATIEPGHSSKNVHPCQEHWATLIVSATGQLQELPDLHSTHQKTTHLVKNLDTAQDAAVHLVEGLSTSDQQHPGTPTIRMGQSLSEMFTKERIIAQVQTDSVAALYWHTAHEFLRLQYPVTFLTGDDTKVLAPIIAALRDSDHGISDGITQLEEQVADLESSFTAARARLTRLMTAVEKLRLKVWYAMNVVISIEYEGAKNISTALNNMASSTPWSPEFVQDGREASGSSRPSTSGTSTSSFFDQPRIDTMTILKAPKEYGGPRKLSDPQIDMTRKWLKRVDNFCKGEERIHRFCMEVKLATKKLVGETMSDSPVLWSSELFAREKVLYDEQASAVYSAQPSTRAPSVMSEPLSSSPFPNRFGLLGFRSSFYSQSSSRAGSDLASLISSPGRAPTVTTLDTGNTIFTPPQSNPRSATSISSRSRPASTFEGTNLGRPMDHSAEKARFLENLQQGLTCMLLSDLGCLVWSLGSETDTWMSTVRATQSVSDRLRQRALMARLMAESETSINANHLQGRNPGHARKRSQSSGAAADASPIITRASVLDTIETVLNDPTEDGDPSKFTFRRAFEDILARVSQHVDPNLKLKAIGDFRHLSLLLRKSLMARSGTDAERGETTRRRSLNPSLLTANMERIYTKENRTRLLDAGPDNTEESDTVQLLKRLLFVLCPRTIFRDLQYISAFVSSHTLDNTETGRAFLHVGLATLAWKDEVCRGMVDVADRIVVKDSTKRQNSGDREKEVSIAKAAEYWMIAAREGNAIAQRELASLYLTHPESTPVISMPLALGSDIFKSEMMWTEKGERATRHSSQALCLALHWMQHAANNGDAVARTKLSERQAGRSIR
ncbi:uncharacterized protein A1O9_09705 [Exophiala aquamarina CBS 119918]|uniref:Uncharacterized protein n=1 Tax=Exophiala aquamarina CBS 119918 TaxID=1182545 RepID=A0A072P5H4_9EURO|nr:uncharacterized protein A1O9_09705 [Exophiala aquamarina CBS 119918]KEF54538.1 hypothetical protein A1O9_09705 [Exophiala aquamarina CBS 119918]